MRSPRVAFVGDVLIHNNVRNRGRSQQDPTFTANFEPIADMIREADLACANLESITAGEAHGISGYPRFNAPVELLDGLTATGFDVVNVANNHMLDKGDSGLIDSLRNIETRGLGHVGAATADEGSSTEHIAEVDGLRIGFVSFTDGAKIDATAIDTATVNHFPGESAAVRMLVRLRKIKRAITEVRARCDAVILQLHFGEEYARFPSAFQREVTASLAESDVDAIVCHHPHVLQPAEWVENSHGGYVLILHSIGNFFTGQSGVHRQIGGVFSFELRRGALPGDRVRVADPVLRLTFVDPKHGFAVRPFETVVQERPEFVTQRAGRIETASLYERVRAHATQLTQTISVS